MKMRHSKLLDYIIDSILVVRHKILRARQSNKFGSIIAKSYYKVATTFVCQRDDRFC